MDRRIWAGAVGVAAVLATTACGGGQSFDLSGRVVLESPSNVVGEEGGQPACRGGAGYADIIGGEDVVVYDADGEQVGRSALELGQPEEGGLVCVFPFVVAEVPESSGYALVVGDREPVTYSLDLLRQNDFEVQIALRE